MGVIAAVAGVVVVATGLLPAADAVDVLLRVGPVLGFLVAMSVLSALAGASGLFDVAADHFARWSGGRTWVLYGWIAALATVCTTVLSLDTTAVLLTPVVLAVCRRCELRPEPFAVLVLWLANTASLTLPVSNLTNLLAQRGTGLSAGEYVRALAVPSVVAVVGSVLILVVVYRKDLAGRFETGRAEPSAAAAAPPSGPLRTAAIVVLAFAVAVVVGVPAPEAAAVAALVLAVSAAVSGRPRAVVSQVATAVPWRLALAVAGLFVVVAGLQRTGLADLIRDVAGQGTGPVALLQVAAVAGVAANLINNLPAYAALEPVVLGDPARVLAVLIGVGVAPLVTIWASLSNLLWREQCRRAGVEVSLRRVALLGLLGAPVLTLAATAALAAMPR